MDRRDALKSAAAFAVGAGAVGTTRTDASATRDLATASSRRGPCIDTRDGNSLFYRDWGSGKSIVFLGAWGLPSDMWQYQMTPLSEQGFRCVAYDRRGHGRSSHPGTGYSQLDVALRAGFSSRHVSFIETGRTQPSGQALLALAETLDLPLRERNRLLEAGGYAHVYRQWLRLVSSQ
jgi:pimeloyl-ACP methyl ester carboxylesterase